MFWTLFIWLYVVPILFTWVAIIYDALYGKDNYTYSDIVQFMCISLIPFISIVTLVVFVWETWIEKILNKPIRKIKK